MEIIGKAVRIYETGGPKVLKYEDVSFDRPKKGQVRLKHHSTMEAKSSCNHT